MCPGQEAGRVWRISFGGHTVVPEALWVEGWRGRDRGRRGFLHPRVSWAPEAEEGPCPGASRGRKAVPPCSTALWVLSNASPCPPSPARGPIASCPPHTSSQLQLPPPCSSITCSHPPISNPYAAPSLLQPHFGAGAPSKPHRTASTTKAGASHHPRLDAAREEWVMRYRNKDNQQVTDAGRPQSGCRTWGRVFPTPASQGPANPGHACLAAVKGLVVKARQTPGLTVRRSGVHRPFYRKQWTQGKKGAWPRLKGREQCPQHQVSRQPPRLSPRKVRTQPAGPSFQGARLALSMVLNRRTTRPMISAPQGFGISGGALGCSILLSLFSN